MSTVGAVKVFSTGIASNTTLSSMMDLGGSYRTYGLLVPTMVSGSDIGILTCDEAAGTYRRVFHAPTNASNPAIVINILSSITNCLYQLPPLGQYVKIQLTTMVSESTTTFKIICNT